ncbi:MAG: energy transducer TonB [Vicinamibacterales bacterium]
MSEVSHLLDVFSAAEIARAAGADVREVRALIASGRVPTVDGRFVAAGPAVDAVRGLRAGGLLATRPDLFQASSTAAREVRLPLTSSAAAHLLMAGSVVWLLGGAPIQPSPARIDPANLVYLVTPGPGGGGGGGGLRQPKPVSRAELRGSSGQRSPVPTARADRAEPAEPKPVAVADPAPAPAEVEPPPAPQPDPAPVMAPVAARASDQNDRTGVPADVAPEPASQGSGVGGGAGTGSGSGLGEGDGSGIGAGSNGGTGGGPYRPGSGVTPPALLKEVKPDYTEDARRRGVTGDVELEIVVRRDGSVGEVRLMRGLGAGLDQRAIDAVRQWRFAPARRQGAPVDVVVEVAVEFTLR